MPHTEVVEMLRWLLYDSYETKFTDAGLTQTRAQVLTEVSKHAA